MAIPNNLLGGFGAGFNAGNAMTQNMIDTRKQNEFARLASQSYSAAPDQQQGLLGQMAAIDPAGAQAQQGQFQQQDDRRKAQLVNASRYLDRAFKSGDQAAIQGAYRAVKPAFQQLDPSRPLPDEADDSMLPMLHQILATADGGAMGANVQSTYVDGDGNRVAIMRDGTTQVLGANDAGATQQTITINGPDGRPAQYTFDRRTGSYIPAGASMGAPQAPPSGPQQFTGSDGAQVSIGADIPPNVAAQIRAMEAQGGVPDQIQAAPVSVAQPSYQGSPFVGRSPDEQAALTTAAQEQTKLAYLPAVESAKADAAIRQASEIDSNKGATARRSEQPAAQAALADANSNLDRLAEQARVMISHPGLSGVAGIRGAIPDIPGSKAADARAEFETLKSQIGFGVLQAMRAASKTGGALGAVSDAENKMLQGNLTALSNSQSVESLRQNLAKVIDYVEGSKSRMNQAYQSQYGDSQGGAPRPPQPGTVQSGYRFLGGDPADQSNWEKL